MMILWKDGLRRQFPLAAATAGTNERVLFIDATHGDSASLIRHRPVPSYVNRNSFFSRSWNLSFVSLISRSIAEKIARISSSLYS